MYPLKILFTWPLLCNWLYFSRALAPDITCEELTSTKLSFIGPLTELYRLLFLTFKSSFDNKCSNGVAFIPASLLKFLFCLAIVWDSRSKGELKGLKKVTFALLTLGTFLSRSALLSKNRPWLDILIFFYVNFYGVCVIDVSGCDLTLEIIVLKMFCDLFFIWKIFIFDLN